MFVTLIAAIGENNELGSNGALIWKLPGDLALFRKITSGHHVIMGRKTYESIGKPLPNRVNIVLSKTMPIVSEDSAPISTSTSTNLVWLTSLRAALEYARNAGETEAFVIGGSSIYAAALPLANRLYISHVHAKSDTADVWFPAFNVQDWTVKEQSLHMALVGGPAWTSCQYERARSWGLMGSSNRVISTSMTI